MTFVLDLRDQILLLTRGGTPIHYLYGYVLWYVPPNVSVAVEEDYFIFFSREGERSRVERRVEKKAGYSEEIGTNVSVE